MKLKLLFFSLLMIGLTTSCVKDEMYKGPAVISDLRIDPMAPLSGQAVTVLAKVTDLDGINSVMLYYAVNGGSFTQIEMISLSSLQDTYSGQIPAQTNGATVTYYIKATNKSGIESLAPQGAPTATASYTIGAPLVLMNEIYSRGTIESPDWIELYNASDVAADISGFNIYDSGGQSGAKPKKTVPDGTVIPAKGFYVIVVDDGTESGFGLSSAGEQVWLENASGNQIDNATFPAFETTQSFGRVPDGGANWLILNTITRGAANSSEQPLPQLYINEIFSQGTAEAPDWVEIYNASAFDADLSGWKIYDSGGQSGTKPKKEFPAGASIPAKGFYVFVVDDGTESGFGLSSNGEQIWLENPQGTVARDVTFPALASTQSYGCYPDGSDQLQVFEVVTQGAANSNEVPVVTSVVLNEVFSRGTAEEPDWIELYNDGETAVDLTGWKIYDSGGQSGAKPKMEIPAGTTIAAKAFLVVTVDDGTETGFGLSSGGEKVWLDNTTMATDSIEFPALEETQSYGRYPDGSSNLQVLGTVTKGAPNDNTTPQIAALFVNEVYSRGVETDPDWIEIYNDGNTGIDLSGWKIYDSGGQSGAKPKKEFPSGTVVASKGFAVIVVDDGTESGFGLSSGGEKVWFEKPDGTLADSLEFPALDENTSYGRYPDGSSTLQVMTTVTKGAANTAGGSGTIIIVMNEVFSRGTADNLDWVEIYNDSNIEADLTGYKIYDSGGQAGTKPKKEFPAGTIIPSKGFFVIVVDDDDASGFGISSNGEQLWLEKPDGTVIDSPVVPALTVTQSYGRQPDGSENWTILTTITRGSSNNGGKKSKVNR
ncbi:MAG TPA: lamin tail domain-containing protein [Bacteroidales bacterium]|nr:lamin tail domain-containing protein [Bacteroidales bacterium]